MNWLPPSCPGINRSHLRTPSLSSGDYVTRPLTNTTSKIDLSWAKYACPPNPLSSGIVIMNELKQKFINSWYNQFIYHIIVKNRISSTIQLNQNMSNYEENLLDMTFEAIRRVHNWLFIRLNYRRLVIRMEELLI